MREVLPLTTLAFGIVCGQALQAQKSPGAIAAAGYSTPPLALRAAPGQVIALSVYGLDSRFPRPVVATGLPLPTALGGISVALQQLGTSKPLPLLAIQQSQCDTPFRPEPCAVWTSISVQVPFEVVEECLLCGRPPIPGFLVVSENGVPRASVELGLPGDSIHIISTCEATALPFRSGGAPCGKAVTHADGSFVSFSSPARPGEVLVVYAFGLGRTNPPVKSGEATPASGVALDPSRFLVSFDYRPNAPPTRPLSSELRPSRWFDTGEFAQRPLYIGLVPGFVGLYQINLRIPETKPSAGCAPDQGIESNVTVTFSTPWSFDGVPICVDARDTAERQP